MNKFKKQFNLSTGSDTELLLEIYLKEKNDCFKILDGMFGFAILDSKDNKLIFARDFMGRIPLYYYNLNEKIVISSELKVISKTFNINASNIDVVEPGNFYIFDIETGNLKKNKFYDFPNYTKLKEMTEDYATKKLKKLIEDAVGNELISDVPVCTILSGGVDSTIITHILSKRVKNLEAFVVSVGETGKKDDLYYARKASKEIGVPLHEVILDLSLIHI